MQHYRNTLEEKKKELKEKLKPLPHEAADDRAAAALVEEIEEPYYESLKSAFIASGGEETTFDKEEWPQFKLELIDHL